MSLAAIRTLVLSRSLLWCFGLDIQGATQPCPTKDSKEFLGDALRRILGGTMDHAGCQPDLLHCLSDPKYALQCPLACQNIRFINGMLQSGQDKNLYEWLEKALREASLELCDDSGWTPKDITAVTCAPCPHINCCCTFKGTLAEALLIESHMYKTSPEVVSGRVFEELALQGEAHLLGFNSSPVDYYTSTVKFFYTAKVTDLGWINMFLGNIMMYGAPVNAGVHAYRKVPLLDDGTPYADFSTVNVPMPPNSKPLVIAVVGDAGCGNEAAVRVLEEMKKQQPDIVIHLGDTYYSGTQAEQTEWVNLLRKKLGDDMPVFMIPGNHDYYSNGTGFMWAIDEFAKTQTMKQAASFATLRGDTWQIVLLDTGILDSYLLNGLAAAAPLGEEWKKYNRMTLAFLPDDQLQWALKQIEYGKAKGLKTILMSHHQLFSRHESMGFANGGAREWAFGFDERAGTYETKQWDKKSTDLPGRLDADVQPAVNTRLLDQFPPEVLADVSAWFWGHEHAMTAFKPYAGLSKGRLLGHGCIAAPNVDYDLYAPNPETKGDFWGGHPEPIEGSQVGTGQNFWNMGFATISIGGGHAHAKYFELSDWRSGHVTKFTNAVVNFEEELW